MKHLQLIALFFLILAPGCGPETPVGTFAYQYTPPPPDMAQAPRLSVAKDGTITDRLMNNQPCEWGYNRGCEKRCFPLEPLFAVCEGTAGRHYYTRQGLFEVQGYGRLTTFADPSCQGQPTSVLYRLALIPDQVKGKYTAIRVCDGFGDLTAVLYDRNWYDISAPEFLPASVEDLPKTTEGGQ